MNLTTNHLSAAQTTRIISNNNFLANNLLLLQIRQCCKIVWSIARHAGDDPGTCLSCNGMNVEWWYERTHLFTVRTQNNYQKRKSLLRSIVVNNIQLQFQKEMNKLSVMNNTFIFFDGEHWKSINGLVNWKRRLQFGAHQLLWINN